MDRLIRTMRGRHTTLPQSKRRRLAAVVAVLSLAAVQAQAAPPKTVASIRPLHALVAGVMDGVAEPKLLLGGTASPHSASLRPSQATALADADLIFWLGPELELFLERPLASLASGARVIRLGSLPGVRRPAGPADAHLWLDPANAQAIAAAAARHLGELDPGNRATYEANATALAARLDGLDDDMRTVLAPVAERPFAVYHDAYRHLQAAYGLNSIGALVLDPERRPGARRLAELRARIVAKDASCLFVEPQFPPALAATVVEGTGAKLAELDPLGADLTPGPELYFRLMRRIAVALQDCLTETQPR